VEHLRIVSLAAAAQTSMQPELLGTLNSIDAMLCSAMPSHDSHDLEYGCLDMVQMVQMAQMVSLGFG
jgi:hypothetical protein